MGISRLLRLISEDLSRAFTTREFQKFCYEIQNDLNLYKLTGYPENFNIPIKDAAKQAVEYLNKKNRLVTLLNHIIHSANVGFKGEAVVFNNIKSILREMKECGYEYNSSLNKVVKIDRNGKRNDWGYLDEGKPYSFCFVSIDICGNSKLVRKYDPELIQKTYSNFKNLVANTVEKRNGRIWSWEGDGGLIAFHIKDFVNQAVLSSIDILSKMAIFNLTLNNLDDPINIRIGINAGFAEYKSDIEMINSESIAEVKIIEKNHTMPMTISLTSNTLPNVDIIIRNYFINKTINGKSIFQLKLPILGV